jgi:lipid II:glycine glycyltransferase (peptidoglycan interpeptide bridge formation enzyme)
MKHSFFTKDQDWIDKWDNYLQETERGLYNQLSDWIKSYSVYGFEHDFYLITENDKVVGGCGLVIAKFLYLKFLIVPSGPVLEASHENEIDNIIVDLKAYALRNKCCYFQINLPLIKDSISFQNYTLNSIPLSSLFFSGQEGLKFKYVIPLFGMRLINLNQKSHEEVVQKFSSNHKRNLKKSTSYNFEFKFVHSEDAIFKAYECFVLNSQQKGYPIRSYDAMKATLLNYVSKDFAKIGCCFYNNQIIGAIYVIKCGKRLTYINGGVLKEFQDLPVSIFMHNEIIKYSINSNYKSYDVSVGGSQGVVRFKEGFGSDLYLFQNSRYWILKPNYFSFYLFCESKLKSQKQLIAKMLFFLKKLFK